MTSGLNLGAPTVILPQLRKEANSTESSDEDMALVSWASSALSFAGVPWVIIITAMAHFFGRKNTMLFVVIGLILAHINLYYSADIIQIIISQAVLGISAATVKTLNIMVVTEYSIPKFRGLMLSLKAASFFWGIWIANTLGTFFHWTTIAQFGIACSVFNFILIITVPESPYWLAEKNKYDQCAASHRWVKGFDDDSEKELDVLISDYKATNHKQKHMSFCTNMCKNFRLVAKPEVYKAILCCIAVISLYDWSGKLACVVYALDILKKITGSEQTAYSWMLILDGITVLGMYLASGLMKIIKRRTLLFAASFVCLFVLGVMTLYFYLIRFNIIKENRYVSMALLVCYSLGVCLGPLVMVHVIYGEIMPVQCSVGVIIVVIHSKLSIGIALKIMPYVLKHLGLHGAFLIFGIGFSVILFINYKFIPETKNKTLLEIRQYFRKSAKSKNKLRELVTLK